MVEDYFTVRERLRRRYVAERPKVEQARTQVLGQGQGFLAEIGGRVLLTAPAKTFSMADELPPELAQRWEKASGGNPFMTWLQGRFVEAERANRNGAYWSTADLQFGEMSVRHGPLNWLHEENTVVGVIADNALVHPKPQQLAMGQMPQGWNPNSTTNVTLTTTTAGLEQPRPYIAAVSAVWRWVQPERAFAIEKAGEEGELYYSMECIARQMACVSDGERKGCDQAFDYLQAMSNPEQCCEHIANRSSARRMVDPAFLGGAVIVPPVQPGWGGANVELMRQASKLAEQTHEAAASTTDEKWESLMASLLRYVST